MARDSDERGGLHESAAFRLMVLGTHLANDFAAHLREVGLTPKHLGLLAVVDRGHARTQDEVARLMRVSPSLVVRLVDHLEERGFLDRRRDPANRRRHILSLTADGEAVIEKAGKYAATLDTALTAGLTGRRTHDFDRTLASLMRQLAEPAD